ncbi:lysylphosphatidylglycerol synthase transmembrane domain-containing protein [Natronolimnohabitans sp. A-GB9]|uniref:lysylphosphatidylglycerol synthase transmembrane domain-containing protein n=1 Tax=Natronolimnohabitans sp. A-GB9 TaxID=3069757 RepID=UPI0027B6272B|nr:lysylphosphatidylglycerol synthase transmembrane domain-containing protein [Natronolimnohabitans sp. A-GB9]MDQ2048873.1 lysylphosphatidylglycerol synthase transmembrane domain-containing protein [Natronolimnohabitans sp. A-GB9]
MNRKLLLWIVGICLLAGLAFLAGWRELWSALQQGNPLVIAALCLVQFGTLGLIAYQWQFLFDRAGVSISFRRVFEVTLAGLFVESATPSSKLGGMAAKVYLFERTTNATYGTISSVLLAQKYVSLPPFAVLCVGALGVGASSLEDGAVSSDVYGLVGGFVAVVVAVGAVLTVSRRETTRDGHWSIATIVPNSAAGYVDRAQSTLRSVVSGAGELLDRRGRYWLYAIAVLLWFVYPLKIYVVALTLGVETTLTIAFVGTYLAYLVGLAPISPGGTGTFEGTLALVFLAGGASFAEGLSVALLARVVTFWVPLALSAVTTAILIWSDEDAVPDDLGLVSRALRLLRRVRG